MEEGYIEPNQPNSSGGPLFDENGNLIGINSCTIWLLVITILQKKYLEMMVVFILVNPMGLPKKYLHEILIM